MQGAEVGFYGSWYGAVVTEARAACGGVGVRYATLVRDDNTAETDVLPAEDGAPRLRPPLAAWLRSKGKRLPQASPHTLEALSSRHATC